MHTTDTLEKSGLNFADHIIFIIYIYIIFLLCNRDPSLMEVLVGEHNVEDFIPAEERLFVSNILNHPRYDHKDNFFDISILSVSTWITFSSKVSPICLPAPPSDGFSEYPDYSGDTATVIGWGTTSSGGSHSSTLLEVDVTVMSNEDCQEKYVHKIK